MDSKKFAAVFAVALMVLTAMVVVSDESQADSQDKNTMEVVSEIPGRFGRTAEKMGYYGHDPDMRNTFLTNEICDELFKKYINGESKDFITKVVQNPQVGSSYYYYSLEMGYGGEFVEISRDPATNLLLHAGMNTLRLMTSMDYIFINDDRNHIELKYNLDVNIKEDSTKSAMVQVTKMDFEHFKPVLIKFDEGSLMHGKCAPTKEVDVSSTLVWYHDDITVGSGRFWDERVYMIPKTSDGTNEKNFVKDVIEGGKSDFKRSEYGILEYGDVPEGKYAVYAMDYSSNPWYYYLNLGNGGVYELPLYKDSGKTYNMYTKPNTQITVGLDYDDTTYTAVLIMGYDSYRLSAGYTYAFDVTYAIEVMLYLEPNHWEVPLAGDKVKIETTQVETEAGSPTIFAALCIVLAALVFVVLFLSNRKPHW